jgi:hypothetical protein
LETFLALASVSDEANLHAESLSGGQSLAEAQASFAAARVESSGCLGKCGSGPNCVSCDEISCDDVFRGVYKPASAAAILDHIGVHVPDTAVKAWVRRAYALRALRSNSPAEARNLLTEALQTASVMKRRAANLMAELLDMRGDVAEALKDARAAEEDRARAAQMRRLQ